MENKTRFEDQKRAIIEQWRQVRTAILDAASSLPPASREKVFLGSWSVMDLLAHLCGWDHANIDAVQAVMDARLPAFYAQHDRDWRTFNALLVSQYKANTLDAQITSLRASHDALLSLVERIPAECLFRDYGVRFKGYRVIVSRLLHAEMQDEQEHLRQISSYLMSEQIDFKPEV